jgi:hypothetical protein
VQQSCLGLFVVRAWDGTTYRRWRARDDRVRSDVIQDQGAHTHYGMLTDGAGSDDDGEAGQPCSLANENIATGLRDRDLTLGAKLGEVMGAGQDRHAVAKEGVLPDGDLSRGQVKITSALLITAVGWIWRRVVSP